MSHRVLIADDAAFMREMLRDILGGERKELPEDADVRAGLEVAEGHEQGQATAS